MSREQSRKLNEFQHSIVGVLINYMMFLEEYEFCIKDRSITRFRMLEARSKAIVVGSTQRTSNSIMVSITQAHLFNTEDLSVYLKKNNVPVDDMRKDEDKIRFNIVVNDEEDEVEKDEEIHQEQ